MATTPTPIYAQTPVSTSIALSATANTSRTPTSAALPTNAVLVSPSTNTNGVRVDSIQLCGTGTTVAGVVCVWLVDSSNNANVVDELTVSVVTPSTTATCFTATKLYNGWVLAPGYKLYATSQVSSQLCSIGMFGGAY